jgi:outer membrane protein OmpA-like peptidoglycan-associated protein
MKKILFLSGIILLFSQSIDLSGQEKIIREDFLDAEFFLSEEDYQEALFSYQKVYRAGYENNAHINYRIGMCYLNIDGEKVSSISYLEKAVTNISKKWAEGSFKEAGAPPDAYLYLGNAYRINYKLDDAIKAYDKYKEYLEKSRTEDIEYTDQQIRSCERARKAMQNPLPLYKENLGKKYNSNSNNYHIIFSGNRQSMAFMNQLRFYDATYFATKLNGTWSNTINITSQIESDGNQYICSFSNDGLKLFLVKISESDADIYYSEYTSGRWMPSKSMDKPINTKYFESHVSVSPDGKTLYLTSNRKESIGGMDIFTSTMNEDGNWSEPVNLGPNVNTLLNEETPFIAGDGKTLFFSSQGHETIGGYDYFKTIRQPDNTWSKPEALPFPINTTDDDLFFFPTDKENSGYLTLYLTQGLGSGDLYYIEPLAGPMASAGGESILNVKSEKPVVPVQVQEKEVPPPPKEPEVMKQEEKVTEIVPPPLPSPKYIIKPVYFDFDSHSLTDLSKAKLNDLADALKQYPNLSLQVMGYTDAIGTIQYNQSLSERRAKAVIDYIAAKGVEKSRLKLTGYGESGNVAINRFPDGRDSIEGRKLNRRVEFRIVTEGGALIQIEAIDVPPDLKIR